MTHIFYLSQKSVYFLVVRNLWNKLRYLDMVAIEIPDTNVQKNEVSAGEYVLDMYENQVFPGQVKEVAVHTVLISAMEKCGGNWKWPRKPDAIWYFYDDIKRKTDKPCQISKREIFKVPELPQLKYFAY
nr:uncharacterized protein LOC111505919 isoform X2 [Leptinotarsa decemlineata]